MTFQSRQAHALDLLKATGMWRSNYEPPIVRLLWKIGAEIPPPHFLPFWKVTVFGGLWFGGVWGAIMWLTSGMPWPAALTTAGVAGIGFGLAMATYYAYGRRKRRLPDWKTFK